MLKRHYIEETCYPIQLRACSTTARRVYWPSRRERPLDCLLSAGLGRLRSDEKSNHQTSNPAYSSFRCAILLETHEESLALVSRTLSGSQTAGPHASTALCVFLSVAICVARQSRECLSLADETDFFSFYPSYLRYQNSRQIHRPWQSSSSSFSSVNTVPSSTGRANRLLFVPPGYPFFSVLLRLVYLLFQLLLLDHCRSRSGLACGVHRTRSSPPPTDP